MFDMHLFALKPHWALKSFLTTIVGKSLQSKTLARIYHEIDSSVIPRYVRAVRIFSLLSVQSDDDLHLEDVIEITTADNQVVYFFREVLVPHISKLYVEFFQLKPFRVF